MDSLSNIQHRRFYPALCYLACPVYPFTEFIQAERQLWVICIQQQPNHRASRVLYCILQLFRQFIGYGALPVRDEQDIRVLKLFLVYQPQGLADRRFKIRAAVKEMLRCG